MTDVKMPPMGESIAEGTISVWLIEPGQAVQADQPLVTVSTDKADVDVPSPVSGVLSEILAKEGETVQVGALIARIDETGAVVGKELQKPGVVAEERPKESPPEKPEAMKPAEGVPGAEVAKPPEMAVKKDGPAEHPARPEGVAAAEVKRERRPEEEVTPPPEIRREHAEPEAGTDKSGFYSPAVMRLAVGEGIDLKTIKGTGEGGRVTKSDVLKAIVEKKAGPEEAGRAAEQGKVPSAKEAAVAEARPESAAPTPTEIRKSIPEEALRRPDEPEMVCIRKIVAEAPVGAEGTGGAGGAEIAGFGAYRVPVYEVEEGDTELPFSRLRRLIADHMVYSKRTSPHVTTVTEADFEHIVELRSQIKDKIKSEVGISLTYMPFVMAAAVMALKEFPVMNSVVQGRSTGSGDVILTKRRVNLGVAVDSERGLMVPVIRDAEGLQLIDLAKALDELSKKVRDRKVMPDEMTGGTFTVTNPGRRGNLFGTPIISQPQVGILRMGELVKRAVVVTADDGEDAIAIRPMMYLALSYDHRVVDGLTANEFLHRIKEHIEKNDFKL